MFCINSIEIQNNSLCAFHFITQIRLQSIFVLGLHVAKNTVFSYTNTGIAYYKATKRTLAHLSVGRILFYGHDLLYSTISHFRLPQNLHQSRQNLFSFHPIQACPKGMD